MKKRRWRAWDSNLGRQDGRRRQFHWAMAAPLNTLYLLFQAFTWDEVQDAEGERETGAALAVRLAELRRTADDQARVINWGNNKHRIMKCTALISFYILASLMGDKESFIVLCLLKKIKAYLAKNWVTLKFADFSSKFDKNGIVNNVYKSCPKMISPEKW